MYCLSGRCGAVFYVNGFNLMDGNLKTVPGSHLIRDDLANGRDDDDLTERCAQNIY